MMEKLLKSIVKKIKIAICLALLLVILFVVLTHLGVIDLPSYEKDSTTAYYMAVGVTILTLVVFFGSVKLFDLMTTHHLRRMNSDEALRHYYLCSICVRVLPLSLLSMAGFAVYYMTLDTSNAICALMLLVALLTSWPKIDKVREYLDTINKES